MNPQLKGAEKLHGTYLFDLATSAKALRLNRFLHGFTLPGNRALFKENPVAAFDRARLSPEERRMVSELDWAALMRYGASFFCLEKLARVKGVSNPEMVAGFRGESLEEFLKTRNVPGARQTGGKPRQDKGHTSALLDAAMQCNSRLASYLLQQARLRRRPWNIVHTRLHVELVCVLDYDCTNALSGLKDDPVSEQNGGLQTDYL